MRYLSIFLLGFSLGVGSLTAYAAKPVPDNLEPLPEPSLSAPPLFDAAPDTGAPDDEPQVTIIKQTGQTVEEYRVGGKLYMVKITPKHGIPYYLVDERGDGKLTRQESLDSGFRPPRWVIKRF